MVVLLVAAGIYWFAGNRNNAGTVSPPGATNTPSTTSTPAPVPASAISTNSSSTAPASSPASTPKPMPVLNIRTSATAGTYLAATNGMTLYTYSKDTAGTSNCTGICATFWPPYTVTASQTLIAGSDINGALGTIARGSNLQLTYNGLPLYFWLQDNKPGDVTGNNVNGFIVAKP